MMLTPAWPRAGPTGRAGVALAAGIWSLICPTTFFIPILLGVLGDPCGSLELLDLEEIQLHRGRAAEDGDHDFQGVAVEVDFLHHPLEVREGPVDDADALPALERVLGLRLLDR